MMLHHRLKFTANAVEGWNEFWFVIETVKGKEGGSQDQDLKI